MGERAAGKQNDRAILKWWKCFAKTSAVWERTLGRNKASVWTSSTGAMYGNAETQMLKISEDIMAFSHVRMASNFQSLPSLLKSLLVFALCKKITAMCFQQEACGQNGSHQQWLSASFLFLCKALWKSRKTYTLCRNSKLIHFLLHHSRHRSMCVFPCVSHTNF